MRGVSFALTALDVRMVDPAGFDLHLPEWLNTPPAKVPVVRLFGVSRQGASVCVHVHGSWPFFYVELSEEAATALSSTRRSCENRGPCTEAASTSDEIVACAELAAAIEDAAKKLGRPQARVVNLKLERWCSIYGLHLQPLPFLRVEVADSRDVEPLAFALQRGEVKDVGCAQAHEAHLPYLLHFLAEYHLCGAGFVRASGQERASRQSCCAVELDVMVDGLINATEYQELLRRAGPRGEAKALASLRSQMGQPPDRPAPKPVADSRPLAGARTTPGVRAALKRWLQGGEPPGAEATAAASAAAAEMQANWQRAQDAVQDIEDLAGRSSTSSRPVRREASPARYSNPADDPRNCRETFAKFPRPSPPPGQPRILQSVPVKEQEKPAAGSSPAPKEAVPRTSVESDDASWEDLAAFLSLEVLAVSPPGRRQKHDEESRRLAAIGYAWRPHGCLLGGKRMRPRDRHGALVVADTLQEEEWRASMEKQGQPLELRCVKDELDLLNALVELIHSADPDVCLGWELRSRSWGFILARARTLGAEDLRRQLSRVPHDASPLPLPQPTSASAIGPGQDPRTYESEMIAPSDLQLPGRLLLNVWRLLMHITFGAKLRSFAPQEAAKELLGRSFPCFPLGEVDRHWLEGTAQARLALLQHTATLASLSLEVSDALEIFPRAGELSRLFGMDVLSGFTRGTQLRVESLLMRVARAAGFLLLSASQEQVRAQPALECLPLVMEPCSGFYWDPVLVLDFKGMYPSLIVAHNISFDTCLGHFRRTLPGPRCQMGVRTGSWQLGTGGATSAAAFESSVLEEPSSDSPVRVAASGSLFVSPKLRQGLLPLMLAEVLQLRAETKRLAKQSSTSPAMAKRLEHKQFALKYFANVTYGYSSASFSGRMPCSEIADSIVATGRRALEEAANFIEATWPGAKVIYGDTDSVFVQLRGYSLEEAFKAGRDICSQVSAKHPQPVELEFEKVYMPCLCLTKKRYGGMAYAKPPSEGGTASFEAKGLEAIRRDQCRLASNVQYEILTEFFRTKDLSAAKRIFVDHAADLLKGSYDGKHTLTDLSFFREARLGTYRAEAEDGGSATLPPQAIAARSRIAAEGEDELFQPLNKEEREMKVILQLISEKAAQKFNSIRSALRHLDADCDGNVDRSEVRHFFRGYNFTEEVADRFFEYLDKEKRGMLDYAKFVNFIRPFLEGAINGTPLTARDLTSCRGAPDSVLEDMLEVTDERQDRLHEFDGKFQESLRILTSKALDRFGSLANAFRFVDLDRNCNMTRNETEYLFRLCNLPAELAVKFHDAVDTNGSGEISLQEFHAALAPYLSDEDQKRQQLKKKKDYLLKPYTPERADEDLRSASKRAASKEWNKHVDFELRNELRRLMQDVGDKLLLKFKHVRDAFKPLNLQRLGKITREEMHNFFRGFGHPEEVADRIFDLLDQEGKGEIEYSVFMSHFESVLGRDFRNFSEQPPIYLEDPIKCKEVNETADSLKRHLLTRSRNMKEAFRALDSDHDGQVSRSELRMFGKKVGVTMQSCDQLFDALDVEGVGSINFLQFTRIFPEGKNAGTPRAVYAKPVPQPPELL